MDKCPRCNGPIRCLGGCSSHHLNWYCENNKCGWRAWDYDISKEKKIPLCNVPNDADEDARLADLCMSLEVNQELMQHLIKSIIQAIHVLNVYTGWARARSILEEALDKHKKLIGE